MDQKEERILQTMDFLIDDILDFTCRLCAEPSTLGHESSALGVMERELLKLSFHPVRVAIDPEALKSHAGFAPVPWSYNNRYNLVAKQEADGSGGRSALFNGHVDVVSPEPVSCWAHDPFQPIVRDGWIYGRGAADMKSGIAAMVYAVHAVRKAGFGLKAPITIEGVLEEECTGNGALACLLAGYDAEAVLIPEPMGSAILTNQLGVLWFKVSIRGVSGHVHVASEHNSIEKSFLLIAALRQLEAELNQAVRPKAYQNIANPLRMNVGIFKGGDWPSTIPALAEFHCRFSFFPGMSYEYVCGRIMQTLQEAAKKDLWLAQHAPLVEFYAFRSEGLTIDRTLPAFGILNDCHRSLTRQDADEVVSTATTDVRVFHFFGKSQATCYGPLGENIHGANERVNIASIIHTAKVYALFLKRWCGLLE